MKVQKATVLILEKNKVAPVKSQASKLRISKSNNVGVAPQGGEGGRLSKIFASTNPVRWDVCSLSCHFIPFYHSTCTR